MAGICSRRSAGGRLSAPPSTAADRLPGAVGTLHTARTRCWEPVHRVPAAGARGASIPCSRLLALPPGVAKLGGQAGVLLHCCIGCLAHQAEGCPAPAQQPRKAGRGWEVKSNVRPPAQRRPSLGKRRRRRQPQVRPPARLLPRPHHLLLLLHPAISASRGNTCQRGRGQEACGGGSSGGRAATWTAGAARSRRLSSHWVIRSVGVGGASVL